MGVNKIAALWGFAEATLFFIVPDVWLSIVSRENINKGLIACCYSLLGALLGGTVLFWWSIYDFNTASSIIEGIPAINHAMLIRVQTELTSQGLIAMMLGPLSGIPYKTYTVQAANTGVNFGWFILASIPARLIRFLFVTLLSHHLSHFILRKTQYNPLFIIILCWLLFYAGYFYIMS